MINIENLSQMANQIEAERGVDKEFLYQTIEQALSAACRKKMGSEKNIRCALNHELGTVDFYEVYTVVEEIEIEDCEILLKDAKKQKKSIKLGDVIENKFEPADFGRIAAQTAKQVVIQRLREAEKESVFNEFIDKVGEIVTGTVQRVEGRNYLINLGRTEALLGFRDQIPGEKFLPKDNVRVYIVDIEKTNRSNNILISRTHNKFLEKLLIKEIPEIKDGIIEIKSVSRIPGDRAKVAVLSNNPAIGAVGTCVGQMGNRIQSVIKELNEKIDILEWSDNIKQFISNSLKPAQIAGVEIDDQENKEASVIVPADQLSLAIGKYGTNVRLSAMLTGWKLNIVKEGEHLNSSGSSKNLDSGLNLKKEGNEDSDSINIEKSSLAQAISKAVKKQKEEEEILSKESDGEEQSSLQQTSESENDDESINNESEAKAEECEPKENVDSESEK